MSKRHPEKMALTLFIMLIGGALNALPASRAAADNVAVPSQRPLTTDPIAQTPWLSISDWFSPTFHGEAGSGNALTVRGLLPFETGPLNHVIRATVPFNVEPAPTQARNDTTENISDLPLGAGNLGDITVYDLLVFSLLDGRLGVGPELQLPTAITRASGSGKWSAGPAAGFVTERGRWQLGLFSQSLFSFAAVSSGSPVRQSKIAPIVKYSLGEGWSVGASTMSFTYSWRRHAWRNVPVGLKISKLTSVGLRPINLTGEAEYNVAHQVFTPEWTLRFTVLFFFPQR